MAENKTVTMSTSSDGNVTIALEYYNELISKAAQKPPVVYRTVHKTPEVAASENKAWGLSCVGLGVSLIAVGVYRFQLGVKQTKNLVK